MKTSRTNHLSTLAALAGLALAATITLAGGNGSISTTTSSPAGRNWNNSYAANMTSYTSMTLTGVMRDFRADNTNGGHPDMQNPPANGRGIYAGIVQDSLNDDQRPVFASVGTLVSASARDGWGKPIVGAKNYLASKAGDVPVALTNKTGAVQGAGSFSSWFVDTANVNYTTPFPIALNQVGASWVADCDLGTQHASEQGFGGNKVYSYTYELDLNFAFDRNADDKMTFGADDAMWVFIDGKLVIDLGGDHDYAEQMIELNRIAGLVDGQTYSVKVFYAERTKGNSRIRIATDVRLSSVGTPQVSAMFD